MKVNRDILKALDRVHGDTGAVPATLAPATLQSTSSDAGDGRASPHDAAPKADFLFAVKRALPRLWQKVEPEKRTRREQKLKLVELLAWLAGKHGASAEPNALRRYPGKGRQVEGRVDLRALLGKSVLDVDITFEPTAAGVEKLWAAHVDGAEVLLVCGFASHVEDALTRLNKLCPGRHWGWLHIACLPATN